MHWRRICGICSFPFSNKLMKTVVFSKHKNVFLKKIPCIGNFSNESFIRMFAVIRPLISPQDTSKHFAATHFITKQWQKQWWVLVVHAPFDCSREVVTTTKSRALLWFEEATVERGLVTQLMRVVFHICLKPFLGFYIGFITFLSSFYRWWNKAYFKI